MKKHFPVMCAAMCAAMCTAMCTALAAAAAEPDTPGNPMAPRDGYPAFALGADFSSMLRVTADGSPTYYEDADAYGRGEACSIRSLAAAYGLDAVRLRVWVNPSEPLALSGFSFRAQGSYYEVISTAGACSPAYVAESARAFAAQGQRVMVAFHLSDTWADPGLQFVPAAWSDCADAEALCERVVTHVTTTLQALRGAGVNVAWVQIGNETNTGMLKYHLPEALGTSVTPIPQGCTIADDSPATTANFVRVFDSAARAAKAVCPDAKTVLHLAGAERRADVMWTLGLLTEAGFKPGMCDLLGLSLYPCNDKTDATTYERTALWQTHTDQAIATMQEVKDKYGLPTMLCEIGMPNEWTLSANPSSLPAAQVQAACIEQCGRDVAAFTSYLIERLGDAALCEGFFYWEAATDYLDGYTRGACVSADPGPEWPRTQVVPNPWWSTVRGASTFPAGGLVAATVSPQAECAPLPAPEYYDLLGRRLASPGAGVTVERIPGAPSRKIYR